MVEREEERGDGRVGAEIEIRRERKGERQKGEVRERVRNREEMRNRVQGTTEREDRAVWDRRERKNRG